jgi:hypothetical protein
MATLRAKKRRRTQFGPIVLITIGILLIILMIWQLSLQVSAEPAANSTATPLEISRVSIEEARQAVESGEAFFIDVRGDAFYASEHISGALNLPLNVIETQISSLNPDQWYIPYCT